MRSNGPSELKQSNKGNVDSESFPRYSALIRWVH